MRTWVKRVVIGLVVAVVACCVAFAVYAADYYRAGSEATGLVETGELASRPVPVVETSSVYAVGDQEAAHGLVLYPGAKVDPAAYVPLACELAQRGVFCAVVRMPFNFAFFDIDAAADVMATYPHVGSWWIGGHSLGGAMAAQFAFDNSDKIAGVALLAAYSTADLSGTGLKAEVVYGSADGVLNRQKLSECEVNLPNDAQTLVIKGGNHAGFGDYGPQAGDGEAAIPAHGQQAQTAEAIAKAMEG